jgi:hypothetical protein
MNSARVAGFRAMTILLSLLSLREISVNRNPRAARACRIRSRLFAALAHDVVAAPLPLIEVALASTFDRGTVGGYILPATLRLYEVKALFGN